MLARFGWKLREARVSQIPTAEGLLRAERQLQAAQLAGDVAALDGLLDDRLVAIGSDGFRYAKDDDLAAHRSGGCGQIASWPRCLAPLTVPERCIAIRSLHSKSRMAHRGQARQRGKDLDRLRVRACCGGTRGELVIRSRCLQSLRRACMTGAKASM